MCVRERERSRRGCISPQQRVTVKIFLSVCWAQALAEDIHRMGSRERQLIRHSETALQQERSEWQLSLEADARRIKELESQLAEERSRSKSLDMEIKDLRQLLHSTQSGDGVLSWSLFIL